MSDEADHYSIRRSDASCDFADELTDARYLSLCLFYNLLTMRPPSPSIPEKAFVYEALKRSLRLDGRGQLDLRTPTLTFGPELGWVECAYGKTRCVFLFPVS